MRESIQLNHKASENSALLTKDALSFLSKLHRSFNPRRLELLKNRIEIQKKINQGEHPFFRPETAAIRQDPSWKVAATPADLQKRWVEITGPTDKKMMINAFNSGADVYMADFEDANSPTWKNMIEGQQNLIDAVSGKLSFTNPEGKFYQLNEKIAVLMVRPRGWHLNEKHVFIDDEPLSASLFDFGLFLFHNAHALIKKGTGPYFYLPKLENHLEARLWNDIFLFAQQELHLPKGTIRATVLLETILAAFEMEEILYELREHSAGLNAGRWDYIFSIIKKFHQKLHDPLPDRTQITMTVPFMRAYAKLLVKTCHKRDAHAIGGMAAYIPNRKDKEANDIAINKVQEDKLRELKDGFDGTWVAHPDLVPIAKDLFAKRLGKKLHQKESVHVDEKVSEKELQAFTISEGTITEEGIRKNINITLQYLDAWLSGIGAVAINNLMEDAATAEISRAQLWHWLNHPKAKLPNGLPIDAKLYLRLADEEENKIKIKQSASQKLTEARKLLDQLVLEKQFPEFLTLLAYQQL